jgi:hypothetical protein
LIGDILKDVKDPGSVEGVISASVYLFRREEIAGRTVLRIVKVISKMDITLASQDIFIPLEGGTSNGSFDTEPFADRGCGSLMSTLHPNFLGCIKQLSKATDGVYVSVNPKLSKLGEDPK